MDKERARMFESGGLLYAHLEMLYELGEISAMAHIADILAHAYRQRIADYVWNSTVRVLPGSVQMLYLWASDTIELLLAPPGQEWIQKSAPVKRPKRPDLFDDRLIKLCQDDGWSDEHAFARLVEAELRRRLERKAVQALVQEFEGEPEWLDHKARVKERLEKL